MARKREREKEGRKERLLSFPRLVSDWTHSLTGCTDGEREMERGMQEEEEEEGDRTENTLLLAVQPIRARMRGVWAWPEERKRRAGEVYSRSLTMSLAKMLLKEMSL